MKKATLLFNVEQVVKVSQCENNSESKPSSEVVVSDRLCSRLNVNGISDMCEALDADLMIGVIAGWL